MIEVIIGYILIILGIAMVILSVLVWLGVINLPPRTRTLSDTNQWDVLLELVKKAPWTASVGVAFIYFGLKMIGIKI